MNAPAALYTALLAFSRGHGVASRAFELVDELREQVEYLDYAATHKALSGALEARLSLSQVRELLRGVESETQ